MNTDEFGGYSKPKWHQSTININNILQQSDIDTNSHFLEDQKDDESLCKLVGIDLEAKL